MEEVKNYFGTSREDYWDSFKSSITIDKTTGKFGRVAHLGNCQVLLSAMNGKLIFEIIPNETVRFGEDIATLLLSVDEEEVVRDNVVELYEIAEDVEVAKLEGKPIKVFTNLPSEWAKDTVRMRKEVAE